MGIPDPSPSPFFTQGLFLYTQSLLPAPTPISKSFLDYPEGVGKEGERLP